MEYEYLHPSQDPTFLAGDLMTLVINQDGEVVWSWGERDFSVLPAREPLMDFVKTATAYRRGCGKKYLVTGEMIKPYSVECEKVKMYKKQYEGYFTKIPAVLTTAWRAHDESEAQFLANYTGKACECIIDIPAGGAKIIDATGAITGELHEGKCKITVSAHSVTMITFNIQ